MAQAGINFAWTVVSTGLLPTAEGTEDTSQTITLGVSIAQLLDAPALRFGLPLMAHLVPKEYHRWLPVLVRTLTKSVAVAVAWYLQVVISAVQSAMRGGLMCSRALLKFANKV